VVVDDDEDESPGGQAQASRRCLQAQAGRRRRRRAVSEDEDEAASSENPADGRGGGEEEEAWEEEDDEAWEEEEEEEPADDEDDEDEPPEGAKDEITTCELQQLHAVWRSPDGSSVMRFNFSTLKQIALRAGEWREPPHFRAPMGEQLRRQLARKFGGKALVLPTQAASVHTRLYPYLSSR